MKALIQSIQVGGSPEKVLLKIRGQLELTEEQEVKVRPIIWGGIVLLTLYGLIAGWGAVPEQMDTMRPMILTKSKGHSLQHTSPL